MRNLVKAGAIHAEQSRGAMRRKALAFLSAHIDDEGDGNSVGEARAQKSDETRLYRGRRGVRRAGGHGVMIAV